MNFQGTQAIYLQIANYINEQILLKNIKAQEKIPSVRELAESMEVNPNTVLRAYTYLEEKGIIATQRGLGYFVAEDAYSRVISFKKKEFLNQDLPQMLRAMQLLQIDIKEIEQLYKVYLGSDP